MPLRTRFVRSFAWGLVVTGLVIGLAGEILVIENELVSRELPGADEPVSLWPVVGVGAAIATLEAFCSLCFDRCTLAYFAGGSWLGWSRSPATGSTSTDDFSGFAVRPDDP
jgi:hypothetical protein